MTFRFFGLYIGIYTLKKGRGSEFLLSCSTEVCETQVGGGGPSFEARETALEEEV